MRTRKVEKMQAALDTLKAACARKVRPLRDRSTADQRLGRLRERYPSAARLFDVSISEVNEGATKRLTVTVKRREERSEWAELSDGCYLLRTNMTETDPARLWEIYIGLTQVEFSFRVTKSDLSIRPTYHHHEPRTQAHILVCFLGLVMWRALEKWMETRGLGTCPRKLISDMSHVRSMDVVLPTKKGDKLRLRVVGRPEKRLALLLDRLGLPLPNRPKIISNVVPKTPLKKT
jgi:transposase